MRREVWIDFQDDGDDANNLVFRGADATAIRIPRIGEKVGYRPIPENPINEKVRLLDFVVDVRTFWAYDVESSDWIEEIHVMTSENR